MVTVKTQTGHKILVVDDEQAVTVLLSETLREAGYAVDSANDGFKAIAACKVRTPDVIILDLTMPLMGGKGVYQRVRKEEKTKDIPVIFLASRDEALPKDMDEKMAAEDILYKPVQANELLSRIKAVLREKMLREELKQKEQQIKELQLKDELTDLKSTRFLNEFLRLGIKQSRRYKVPVSICILEIDKNQELAKRLGPKNTDILVSSVATHIQAQMRDTDIVVHTNTFEYAVVLTVTNQTGAIEVAERLRTSVEEREFDAGDTQEKVTVSVGICQFANHMDDDGKLMMGHARAAMNAAHEEGGNMSLMAE